MAVGTPDSTLPERFRQLLKALNHSANSFARLVGVNPSQMVKVASGQTKPSLDTLEKISAAIPRLNLEWLIGGRGDMLKPLAGPAAQSYPDPSLSAPATVREAATSYATLEECQRELGWWQERARMFETLAADRQLIIDLLRQRGPG